MHRRMLADVPLEAHRTDVRVAVVDPLERGERPVGRAVVDVEHLVRPAERLERRVSRRWSSSIVAPSWKSVTTTESSGAPASLSAASGTSGSRSSSPEGTRGDRQPSGETVSDTVGCQEPTWTDSVPIHPQRDLQGECDCAFIRVPRVTPRTEDAHCGAIGTKSARFGVDRKRCLTPPASSVVTWPGNGARSSSTARSGATGPGSHRPS